jgi:uncharacterized coiled-coil protein SlyX
MSDIDKLNRIVAEQQKLIEELTSALPKLTELVEVHDKLLKIFCKILGLEKLIKE